MTIGELIGLVIVGVWLLGIGILAHGVPMWLEEDDFVQMVMVMFPEIVSVLMAIVIVSWPLSIPALAAMKLVRERNGA